MAGVKGRSGGDRKSPKAKGLDLAAVPPLPQTPSGYARLIEVLNKPPIADESTKDPEAAGWRKYWDTAGAPGLMARKFLYTMRDGDPQHTVRYIHDKPLEVNMTLSIKRELEEAWERANKR